MSPITTLAQLILQQLLHSKFHQIFHKLRAMLKFGLIAGYVGCEMTGQTRLLLVG